MHQPESVLVVDDCRHARALIAGELADAGFAVRQAADASAAWRAFEREPPDLVVTDVCMPQTTGFDLLSRIRAVSRTPVILITAYADVPTAVSAMAAGATGFLRFPEDLSDLVPRARAVLGAERSIEARLERMLAGRSAAIARVRRRVRGLCEIDVPVLVEGESGSGRSHVTRLLHMLGPNCDQPLTVIDCARAAGLPRLPSTGGVILDDVDRLPPAEQARWFAVLTERRACGVRVYATATASLSEQCAARLFHAGLANELSKFRICLPPLRLRPEDVEPLTAYLVERAASALGRVHAQIGRPAIERLEGHGWPGNVRELAAVVERLVAFAPGGAITSSDVEALLGEDDVSVETQREQRERRQLEELARLLEECGGNLSEIARRLGLTRGAVFYRARKYGLFRRLKPGP
jgi:DNA-binding NtrC family response regulator